jgi:plasmid stabilization system protein ParE
VVKIYALRWTKQAKGDLRKIFTYILKTNSRERAVYVIGGIKEEAAKITLFPAKHAKEPEDIPGNIRFAVKWSYKILFTIEEEHVNIVRVFHTAQNPKKLKDLIYK